MTYVTGLMIISHGHQTRYTPPNQPPEQDMEEEPQDKQEDNEEEDEQVC